MLPVESGVNVVQLRTMYANKLKEGIEANRLNLNAIRTVEEFLDYITNKKGMEISRLVALKNRADLVL